MQSKGDISSDTKSYSKMNKGRLEVMPANDFFGRAFVSEEGSVDSMKQVVFKAYK